MSGRGRGRPRGRYDPNDINKMFDPNKTVTKTVDKYHGREIKFKFGYDNQVPNRLATGTALLLGYWRTMPWGNHRYGFKLHRRNKQGQNWYTQLPTAGKKTNKALGIGNELETRGASIVTPYTRSVPAYNAGWEAWKDAKTLEIQAKYNRNDVDWVDYLLEKRGLVRKNPRKKPVRIVNP